MYSQTDTLLLASVFENFRNICPEIYESDASRFLAAPGLARQTALKKTKVKLDLLTDIDILMAGKSTRGGICYFIYWYEKANNKYMKNFDKNKESSYLQYFDVNDLYRWAMSQKFPVNNFKWIEDTSEFNEDFIKSYIEESGKRYFFEFDVQYPENYMNFIIIY